MVIRRINSISIGLLGNFLKYIMFALWLESGCTVKYTLNPWKSPRAPPSGTSLGLGYISQHIPPLIIIQIQSTPIQSNTLLPSPNSPRFMSTQFSPIHYSTVHYTTAICPSPCLISTTTQSTPPPVHVSCPSRYTTRQSTPVQSMSHVHQVVQWWQTAGHRWTPCCPVVDCAVCSV